MYLKVYIFLYYLMSMESFITPKNTEGGDILKHNIRYS